MHRLSLFAILAAVPLIPAASAPTESSAAVETNDNRTPAGLLSDRVLTLHLEVRDTEWHPDGDARPGLPIRAFAEAGKREVVPGPLIRVPEGTEIRIRLTNPLADDTLVVRGLSSGTGADSVVVPPGGMRDTRFVAGAAGTYYYTGTTGRTAVHRSTKDAALNGAFVVDPRDAPGPLADRILVITLWHPEPRPNGAVARSDLLRFAINGKSWPETERLAYEVGDTVRFRIINTSAASHPMHLHGFYFRVDSRGDGRTDSIFVANGPQGPPQFVVTERLAPGRTFSMTWVPERPGNWMFHCHDNYHVLRNRPLDGSPLPPEHLQHVTNHAADMMGGLVMGITVSGQDQPAVATPSRRLRLTAAVDTSGTEAEPAYGYALQEEIGSTPQPSVPGPTIVLQRGEPVSVTVVNALDEPTAVHWHGIELDSYYDGVADFSGSGTRISPVIAPADSFVAHFTPPRSGTFMYHPHADEVRQQQAGLSGALLVVDDREAYDPSTDIVLLVSVPRRVAEHDTRVWLNGSSSPPPLELRAGVRYRFRVVNIHTFRPNMILRLLQDSAAVAWRAVAKDGMDLPAARATVRPAVQQMGNGETFDFEFTPSTPGELRLTVSASSGVLLAAMPVRVR